MQEAAVFHRTVGRQFTDTPFQGIQKLLAGDGQQAGHIAKGVYLLAGKISQLAGEGGVSDTAAVHDGNIHIHVHLRKKMI